jgi:preprotein translocase subunit Sss1
MFGPRVEEFLNLIQKYMRVLKKCKEGQNAKE